MRQCFIMVEDDIYKVGNLLDTFNSVDRHEDDHLM